MPDDLNPERRFIDEWSQADPYLQGLFGLDRVCFDRRAWSMETWRGLFEHRRLCLLLDVRSPVAVGFGVFTYHEDEAELLRIGVRPEYRRQSIATRLLREMIDRSGNEGVSRIYLEVGKDNEPALRLYRALRFAKVGERRRYYSCPEQDAWIMCLDLMGISKSDGVRLSSATPYPS